MLIKKIPDRGGYQGGYSWNTIHKKEAILSGEGKLMG